MKVAAITLLLLNVAVFAWQYNERIQAAARAAIEREALPPDVAPLVLLKEMPELPPLKDAAAGAAPEPAPIASEVQTDVAPADTCIDAGPFPDAAARDAFLAWMRQYAAALHTRTETVRRRQFFWVYLEPTSEETAQRKLDDLRNRGVKDYMLIRRGDLRNSISLGLFRSQDSVNRRLAELTEKGYQPVVVPRFETSDVYWVGVELAAPQQSAPEIPASVLGEATVSTIACDAMPTATPSPEEAPRGSLVEGLTD